MPANSSGAVPPTPIAKELCNYEPPASCLWLSLVVDEEDVKPIKPLPNLFYKTVTGNSLLGVEKNIFNQQLFQKLEKLKPLYFDQSDASEKSNLRRQIEDTIHEPPEPLFFGAANLEA
jgi:hypothetical protein